MEFRSKLMHNVGEGGNCTCTPGAPHHTPAIVTHGFVHNVFDHPAKKQSDRFLAFLVLAKALLHKNNGSGTYGSAHIYQ